MSTTTDPTGLVAHCSFCGNSHQQVKKLVAGPGVYICDECVMLCTEIIAEEAAGHPGKLLTAEERRLGFEKPDSVHVLNRIEALDPVIARLEADLARMVHYARTELAVDWEQIAPRLHLDADGARARFPQVD